MRVHNNNKYQLTYGDEALSRVVVCLGINWAVPVMNYMPDLATQQHTVYYSYRVRVGGPGKLN